MPTNFSLREQMSADKIKQTRNKSVKFFSSPVKFMSCYHNAFELVLPIFGLKEERKKRERKCNL
jgi:hypothetical protein